MKSNTKSFYFFAFLIFLQILLCHSQDLNELKNKLLQGIQNVDKRSSPGLLRIFGKKAIALITGSNLSDVIGAALIYGNDQGRICAFSHNSYVNTNEFPLLLNCAKWMQEKNGLNTYMSVGISQDKYLPQNGYNKIAGDIFSDSVSLNNVGFLLINLNSISKIEINDPKITKIINFLKNGGGLICGATSWASGEESQFIGNYLLIDQGLFFSNDILWEPQVKLNTETQEKSNIYYAASNILTLTKNGDLKNQSSLFYDFSKDIRNSVMTLRNLLIALKYKGNYLSFSSSDADVFHVLIEIYTSACASENLTLTVQNIYSKACVNLVITINNFNGLARDNNPQILAGEIFPGLDSNGRNWKTLGKQTFNQFALDVDRNRWASTGLYALPGATIQITLPSSTDLKNLSVRIGSHKDDISHKEKWTRFPIISNIYYFSSNTIQFTTYDGGLIYFDIKKAPISIFVDISGEIVRAPYYNIKKTSLSDWNSTIRNYPAPWAEIEGEHMISTIQSSVVRNLNNPDESAKFYGSTMMNSYYEFNSVKPRDYKERWVCDIDISAGYMHSGYPIMSFLDQNQAMVTAPAPASDEKLYPINNGLWGQYHEMGHNFQVGYWTFSGEGEVTNNWMSAYHSEYYPGRCDSILCHIELTPTSQYYKDLTAYLKDPKFEVWQNQPFLALSMWIELRLAFGWQVFKDLIKQYVDAPQKELPKNDDEKRDQKMVRFSKIVNRNLAPFFTKWGIPTSQEAKNSISSLPAWDTSFIVDCSKRWGPKAPCAQMTIDNTNYGEISTYSLTINTWIPLRLKKEESLILTFKGDLPNHPDGKTNDSNFPLVLDSNAAVYLGSTAIYNSSNNTLKLNIIKYLPSETNLKISFTLKNSLNKKDGYVTASLNTYDKNGNPINYPDRNLEFTNLLKSATKSFLKSY